MQDRNHFVAEGRAVIGRLRQHPLDEPSQDVGQRALERVHPGRRLLEVSSDQQPGPGMDERGPSAQHLEEDAPERIYVGAPVDRGGPRSRRLLRGHVKRRAQHHAGHRAVQGVGRRAELGDAKINDLHRSSGAGQQEDVVRLQIAVDDSLAVRRRDGVCHPEQDGRRFRVRQPASRVEVLPQGEALQALHHDVGMPARMDVAIQDPNNAFVLDHRSRTRLGEESGQQLRAIGELAVKDLDGRFAAQVPVLGQIDHAHPTAAQLGDDGVRPYRLTDHAHVLHWRTAV
jgi:hypothetical protein